MLCAAGTAQAESQQWIQPERLSILMDSIGSRSDPDSYRLATLRLAKTYATGLKCKYIAPQTPHVKPVVLTNEAMLTSGRSAGVLLHATLPICILGYGRSMQPARL